jgi:hypothetical protein
MGASTFSTGTPCICGDDLHYTSSGACVTCSIARGKERYTQNRVEIAACDAARYQKRKLQG